MIEKERLEAILQFLRQNKFATIHEIVKLTDSSEATIRRDFNKLENEGRINRLWGGVEISKEEEEISIANALEQHFDMNKRVFSVKKRRIAEAAVSLINDNETIIIDGGSTTFYMTEFMRDHHLTIITNSFPVAEFMVKNTKSKIILPEGIIFQESLVILNPFNPNPYKNYQASKVFISVGGLKNQKLTNIRMDLIQNQRSMVEHADQVIIMADSSKFEKSNSFYLFDLDKSKVDTLITDDGIKKEDADIIRSKGIELIIV